MELFLGLRFPWSQCGCFAFGYVCLWWRARVDPCQNNLLRTRKRVVCMVLLAGSAWDDSPNCGSRCRDAGASLSFAGVDFGARGRSLPNELFSSLGSKKDVRQICRPGADGGAALKYPAWGCFQQPLRGCALPFRGLSRHIPAAQASFPTAGACSAPRV